MRVAAILNRDGGSLRTRDLDLFAEAIREAFHAGGHRVDVRVVEGREIVAALEQAVSSPEWDIVMAGGGDGTVSTAAGLLMETDKVLAVLPAGTMNLFARSLGIPLALEEALEAFASGTVRQVDVASANGTAFVHQLSIGMHPKLIQLREQQQHFSSKLGKMRASLEATLWALLRPPRFRARLVLDGEEWITSTSSIGITNNLFGEFHLPYADDPAGGLLGVYVTKGRTRWELAKFLFYVAIGRWSGNDQVEIRQAREVRVELLTPHHHFGCAIDGEIFELEKTTTLKIHPGVLRVLVPAQDHSSG